MQQKARFDLAQERFHLLCWVFGAIGFAALALRLFARFMVTASNVRPIAARRSSIPSVSPLAVSPGRSPASASTKSGVGWLQKIRRTHLDDAVAVFLLHEPRQRHDEELRRQVRLASEVSTT
ncbi:hypothetical protein LMG27174_05853 [Paraburkholderia rhynchosiae]|uniref:Uncharacterized protein n=2 Tax=Paraburkholderia rhynchosiae TaxID=487049 RepID=A0A2N7W9F9_9BURK|nr:hypothetical protein [Paraburkholderia rhynchosiae]PMS26048.1 hypothetical protein C0Z16_28375 [Paraburkholderia rhynchosiae]CAB3731598.1 hypothetical protein LMG27174_05853 [Paraburkholderia rhynchosiae]